MTQGDDPETTTTTDGGAGTETPAGEQPAVENRWWVDTGGADKRRSETIRTVPVEEGPLVGRLFEIGRGFDQDRARSDLTDSNLNLIRQGNPAEGGWAYLALADEHSSQERIEKVRRLLRLPKWARGVLVDAGTSIRAIATGTPVGERVVELTIGRDTCFDAWVNGEWVHERTFRNRDRALREGSRLIVRHLKSRPA